MSLPVWNSSPPDGIFSFSFPGTLKTLWTTGRKTIVLCNLLEWLHNISSYWHVTIYLATLKGAFIFSEFSFCFLLLYISMVVTFISCLHIWVISYPLSFSWGRLLYFCIFLFNHKYIFLWSLILWTCFHKCSLPFML